MINSFNMSIFAKRFSDLIYHCDLPLERLSEEMDVSRRFIYDMMGLKHTPSTRVIFNICRYFNVSADWLLGLKEERK